MVVVEMRSGIGVGRWQKQFFCAEYLVLSFEFCIIVMDTLNRVTRISFNYDAKKRGKKTRKEKKIGEKKTV